MGCSRIVAHLRYRVHFHFAPPDPVEAILFRMEQQGLRQKDIADVLGGKNRPEVKWS